MSAPYERIHVVINPASGRDEPVLNVLNSVFGEHGVDWSVSVTHKYGDATEHARQAALDGVDLVAGYGGDGTQHEIANGVIGTDVVMGVLPGGTGNGFLTELGVPSDTKAATQLLCAGGRERTIDVGRCGEQVFIQRLHTGLRPDEETSREMKDKYGIFAYALDLPRKNKLIEDIDHHVTIDD